MGKITVFIDDQLIENALRATKSKTKREVIERGLRELLRKNSQEMLKRELGTFDIDLTLDRLEKKRT
jgi:Arc/MetJ family transcription regulator